MSADPYDPSAASGPNSPFEALLADFAARARGRGIRALISAFEHLLRQQPWARERLRSHAGRTVRVAVDAVGGLSAPDLRLTIAADGFLLPADPAAKADATLRFRPSADAVFAALGDGAAGVQRHLRIDGDADLAATLGELAQHLRWDVEEDLSRLVGDVAAHRLVRVAEATLGRLRDLGTRAESSAAQFAATGSQVAVRPQMTALLESAARLDQRLQGLESRVVRLAGA